MVGSQSDISRSENGDADVLAGPWMGRSTTKGRVLVVENEQFLRDSLGLLLDKSGYEVSFADHGREALRLLRAETLPNIIILDLRMPVMDGWEFRTIQKDDPRLGLIPVLVVSADASPKAAAISAEGYLRKPFDSEEVLVAVERVLSENEIRMAARLNETERLTSLGRLAANVGHEINNPPDLRHAQPPPISRRAAGFASNPGRRLVPVPRGAGRAQRGAREDQRPHRERRRDVAGVRGRR